MGSDAQAHRYKFSGEGYSMNSFTPAANGRAGAGFQDMKAGARTIFRAVWHRSLLWLLVRFLPLVILTCCGVHPAQANGASGTISNGQTVTGNVTGEGFDTYTITSPLGGSSFVLSIGETGIHDQNFLPAIDLTDPGSSTRGVARPLNAKLEEINAAAGTWTVNVRRGDEGGTSGGSYALTLVQVPVAAGGTIGSAMSPDGSTSGSITRGSVDVRTFNGVAGHKATLTVSGTDKSGFFPEISVITPTGDPAAGFGCVDGCSQDFPITAEGIYTVIVSKGDDNDVTGNYTLSVK
jgi:hypothetical protein